MRISRPHPARVPYLLLAPLSLAFLLSACGPRGGVSPDGGTDASAPPRDAGAADGGPADAGASDAGDLPDGGSGSDGGPSDLPVSPAPWEACEGGGQVIEAGPGDDYRALANGLQPGDTLRLRPGAYERGLRLTVSGAPGACVVIEALDPADPPIIRHGASNTIDLVGSDWIKIRDLVVDSRGDDGYAGVVAKSEGGTSHHVVIEGCRFVGQDGGQQTVAISTKAPAIDWIVRGNRIEGAGTGLYLGNSNGMDPFVRGRIELNTVLDTIGYGMEIKHQLTGSRDGIPEMPDAPADTLVRYNVFAKRSTQLGGSGARPNLLIGHLPLSGAGSDDRTLVYGNVFYDNPTERLLQAEGNVLIYANLFLNPHGDALSIQPHNDRPRRVAIFLNTVVATGLGIGLSGGDPAYAQETSLNAVFAGTPLRIQSGTETQNLTGAYADAAAVLVAPNDLPGAGLDLHPRPGALGATFDPAALPGAVGARLDFDGRERAGAYAGAYAGPAGPSARPLDLEARAP